MTTHALSNDWLTDPIEWPDGSFDAPFLDGIPARLMERKVIQWDSKPRQGFKLWLNNEESHSGLLVVGEGKEQRIFCSDHDDDCTCKAVVRAYLNAK